MIATIHGDIKAAKRHAAEINRLLKKTNFSDSIYQIKIEPAYNENGQFYDMLMAPELDSKNLDNDGFEGQLSLGEDSFYQKYEAKIRLLTDKFMPVKDAMSGCWSSTAGKWSSMRITAIICPFPCMSRLRMQTET